MLNGYDILLSVPYDLDIYIAVCINHEVCCLKRKISAIARISFLSYPCGLNGLGFLWLQSSLDNFLVAFFCLDQVKMENSGDSGIINFVNFFTAIYTGLAQYIWSKAISRYQNYVSYLYVLCGFLGSTYIRIIQIAVGLS